jgi:hypothetical protein
VFTLYRQAGYDSTIGGLSSGPGTLDNIQAWFARATGRAYITPNLRLEGTALYTNGAHNFTAGTSTVNFQTWLWRAKLEHKFDASPFAIFAAYQGTQTTFTGERVFDHRLRPACASISATRRCAPTTRQARRWISSSRYPCGRPRSIEAVARIGRQRNPD